MFCAGLEIDLALFRRARNRVIAFGILTTSLPLLLGTGVGFLFGFRPVAAVVLGSLLASHTLLAAPTVASLGATRLEPIAVTFGATVVSDTLSLVVFAVCVSTFQRGFSVSGLAVQLIEIAIFVPLILFGLSRLGAYFLRKVADDENAYFVLMLLVMTVAAVLAAADQSAGYRGCIPCRIGRECGGSRPTGEGEVEVLRRLPVHPGFFVVTGFLIDPREFYQSIAGHLGLTLAVIFALLGREVDRGANRREGIRLLSLCADDDVVTHAAAGGGDTRGGTGRLRHVRPRRPAPDR